jgi:hypothetical protein
LPKPVLAHYAHQARVLDLSVDEYLVLKLTSDCFAELTGSFTEKRSPSVETTTPSKAPVVTQSGFKGVYAYGKRWAAVLHENGKSRRLGAWDTPDEAARAYDDALIARAGGDPNAAVNFPTDLDRLRDAASPFVERFASGPLTDIEWEGWRRETKGLAVPDVGPLSVLPPQSTKIDARTPLVDRPTTTLYRRSGDPKPPLPRTPSYGPDFVPPPTCDPDFVPPPAADPDFVPPPLDDPDV